MIALDTNVLVRYLTHDEEEQFQIAAQLIADLERRHCPAYLSVITLCETVWVLTRAYKIDRPKIIETFEGILGTAFFVIENKPAVRQALDLFKIGKGDFADYLSGVLAQRDGCSRMATFDTVLHAHAELFVSPAKAFKISR